MITRLLFMRHAEAAWPDEDMSDHARPLTSRGRRDAQKVGAYLQARNFAPDIIWCSDAKRTRETALLLIRAIPGSQTIQHTPDFYHAAPPQVLQICKSVPEPEGSLMLLGHNPGWAALYEQFTGQSHDFPPASCAVLTRRTDETGNKAQQSDWLSPKAWSLSDLILPKNL